MPTPEEILKRYWGYDAFRPLQREIIGSILAGNDTLVLLPTGGGKSLCYQVPALINEGICLVVSPLIALMQDQVRRLKELTIPAECLYSGMHYHEVKQVLIDAAHGACKLLYISPERIQTELFRDYLREMDISIVAVDEAHCISQWGHDFRPSYLQIADVRTEFPDVPILALTASATTDVQTDIIKQLELRNTQVFKQSFSRNNIYYDVRYSENKNGDTLANVSADCNIIYCRSRKQTEMLAKYLQQSGMKAAAYHAGMTREQREQVQERWMRNEDATMVATTAFGMGIDKPDVRMVLHFDAPEHPEAYYQEAGRAGRDGKPSMALGFYNTSDVKRLRESIELQYPPEAYLRQVYQSVVEYLQIPIGAEPDRYYPFDLYDFCKKFSLLPNQAIHALKLLEREDLWTMTEAVYNPATIQFTADRHTLDDIGNLYPDLGYVVVGLLRMYTTIFHFPTPVRETAIAKQLKISKEQLLPALERLDKMELLKYNRPSEGPQLYFHHYRVDSRFLDIDLQRITTLRRKHETRTKAMIAFLENKEVCRERMLLSYFGEPAVSDCGHCDVCGSKANKAVSRTSIHQQLVELFESKGTLTMQQITAAFMASAKETVTELVRQMIDDEEILLNKDGSLSYERSV